MARVTVEDCMDRLGNQFELAAIASKRARQLARGADARVDWENDKVTVVALREVAAGLIGPEVLAEVDLPPILAGQDSPPIPPAEELAEEDDEELKTAKAAKEKISDPDAGPV